MSAPAPDALPVGPVILDASFVIALLKGEPGAQAHAGALARGVLDALTLGQVHTTLSQRAGIAPATTEQGLRALGVRLVDFPTAAAAHLPAVHAAAAAARPVAQSNEAMAETTLNLTELGVLAHAIATGVPVLTGSQQQVALARKLGVEAHHYRENIG